MADSPTFLHRIAAAPISWGVCEVPGWGLQLPVERVLAEASALGFTAMERGALGWLPTEPVAQRAKLDEYGMRLLGGFVPLVLHAPEQRAEMLHRADRIAENMAASGGSCFVTAAVGSLEEWSRPVASEASWAELLANLARIDEICAGRGLTQAVHPHVDTLIETGEEVQRFLAGCSVRLCLDTGHLTIGGTDVVSIAREHIERIALVHLKDVDGDIAGRQRSGELDLMAATQAGLFPPLGDGMVPIAQVVTILEAAGYDGWYVLETDVALGHEPPVGAGPDRAVARSLDFLRAFDTAAAVAGP